MIANDEIEQLLARLADTPGRIARAVEGLDESQLRSFSTTGEWSALEILAHIRASDDVLAYRAYIILVGDKPLLHAYDERRWAEVARYVQYDFRSLLSSFASRRADLIQMLRHIAPDDWERSGIHEVRGPQSLLYAMNVLLEHEEEHCAQLEHL